MPVAIKKSLDSLTDSLKIHVFRYLQICKSLAVLAENKQ